MKARVPVSLLIISTLILLVSTMQSVYSASSSGNTTVYDYSTNVTLTSGDIVNFECNGTGKAATLFADIDPYIGVNELELIKVYYLMSNGTVISENISDLNENNRTRVVLDLNSTNSYNLTFVAADGAWEALISNGVEIDQTLLFKANSRSFQCVNATYSTKFRTAFYLTLHFYQGNNLTSDVSTEPYKNEFQYVYLRLYDPMTSLTDSTIFKDMSYVDRMVRWLPYYKPSFSVAFDDDLTFWARYNDGEARIKLYEAPENYTVYLMTDDTYGMQWTDEFTRPQFQDYSYTTKVVYRIGVSDKVDRTLGIYLSRWEINKFLFLMNIGYWVLIFIICGIFVGIIGRMSISGAIGFALVFLLIAKIIGMAIF